MPEHGSNAAATVARLRQTFEAARRSSGPSCRCCGSRIEQAIAFIKARDRPLALYLFTGDAGVRRKVVEGSSSGGVCVNDVVVQLSVSDLPFGGVGMSGFGRYHGRAGFETFSNLKSVLARRLLPEPPLRTVPHSDAKLRWIDRLM